MGEAEKNTKKAFYVSLSGNGAKKVESDDVAEIVGLLNENSLEWMDFSVSDILKDSLSIASALKFSEQLVTTILSNRFSGYEDNEVELGLMMPAVRVNEFDVKVFPLLILVRKNLVVTIHPHDVIRLEKLYRYADIFMKKIRQDLPANDKLTILITRLLDENNERNFMGLRAIEEEGDELGKYMVDVQAPRTEIGNDIYKMKHGLIMYLNTLWASLDVVNSLRYGDAEVITDNQKLLARIGILGDDVSRNIALAEHMSEVLASGLEVLQTIYNNQLQVLNNRLAFLAAWLAVLATVVMVPNTLATIFGMPTFGFLDWHVSLSILVISTIISSGIIYMIMRHRGWFKVPK
jgi:magnesium transporter